ncbi:MAG: hypothetical protein R6U46_03525 [Marinilabilia sp.]
MRKRVFGIFIADFVLPFCLANKQPDIKIACVEDAVGAEELNGQPRSSNLNREKPFMKKE